MIRIFTLHFLFFTFTSAFAAKIPAVYLEKMEGTPDLMQSLPDAALPGNGAAYCGRIGRSNAVSSGEELTTTPPAGGYPPSEAGPKDSEPIDRP